MPESSALRPIALDSAETKIPEIKNRLAPVAIRNFFTYWYLRECVSANGTAFAIDGKPVRVIYLREDTIATGVPFDKYKAKGRFRCENASFLYSFGTNQAYGN